MDLGTGSVHSQLSLPPGHFVAHHNCSQLAILQQPLYGSLAKSDLTRKSVGIITRGLSTNKRIDS